MIEKTRCRIILPMVKFLGKSVGESKQAVKNGGVVTRPRMIEKTWCRIILPAVKIFKKGKIYKEI